MRAARLQRHVECCAVALVPPLLRISERLNFRMRLARAMMPAAPNDFAPLDQDCADHGVWRSRAIAPAGQTQGQPHVGGSHSANSASANCAASNGCRSSACSPSPTYLIGNPSSR